MPDPNNILDPETKTIWFCVPKAANGSIKRAVLAMKGIHLPSDINPFDLHNHPALQWVSARDALLGYRHYLRIAVVRNPWARLYSCWRDKCSIQGWWESIPHDFGLRTGMSFREFVDAVLPQSDAEMNIHYRPQSALICHREQIAADVVVKMEDLDARWPEIQVRVAGHCGCYLPPLERSNSTGTRPHYDADLFRRVGIRYAQDVLRFGYDDALRQAA